MTGSVLLGVLWILVIAAANWLLIPLWVRLLFVGRDPEGQASYVRFLRGSMVVSLILVLATGYFRQG